MSLKSFLQESNVRDEEKTKEQLLDELVELRKRLTDSTKEEIEQKTMFRTLLEEAPNPIMIIDESFRYIEANKATLEFFECDYQELLGKKVWELLPQLANNHESGFNQLFQTTEISYVIQNRVKTLLLSMVHLTLSGKRILYYIGKDITSRKVLEKEIIEISEREQRRIGQELHDDVGQLLTGLSFISKVLEQKLKAKSLEEAADAAKLVELTNQAIARTQNLARSIFPVGLEGERLVSALQELAFHIVILFEVSCDFNCDKATVIHDNIIAFNLYRIAQEAVNNAIKHGTASHILIDLSSANGRISLTVTDDGRGFQKDSGKNNGLGLNIMRYRAGLIGATFEIRRADEGGTIVSCSLPKKRIIEQSVA